MCREVTPSPINEIPTKYNLMPSENRNPDVITDARRKAIPEIIRPISTGELEPLGDP